MGVAFPSPALDADLPPYLILGACRPPLAQAAVAADPSVGTLLPCNVVVRVDGERIVVEALDLDLLLVHDGRSHSAAQVSALAERLWYPIWDAGLDLDHSVRSLSQCRQVASADLPAAVGLLDLRHVAGDRAVVHKARSALLEDWRSAARRRLPELLGTTRTRAIELLAWASPEWWGGCSSTPRLVS